MRRYRLQDDRHTGVRVASVPASIIRCGDCSYPNLYRKTPPKLCVCCGACLKCSTSNQESSRDA